MKTYDQRRQALTACIGLSMMMAYGAHAQDVRPGYNTPIPEDIMTPDTIETRMGTLRFDDGRPTP